MRKKNLIAAAVAAALAAVAGCGPFWVDPYITVKESSLNWVSIHYYNLNRTPIRRIGVDIYGSGLVEVRSGESELVSNDFASPVAHWAFDFYVETSSRLCFIIRVNF